MFSTLLTVSKNEVAPNVTFLLNSADHSKNVKKESRAAILRYGGVAALRFGYELLALAVYEQGKAPRPYLLNYAREDSGEDHRHVNILK